MDCLDKQALLRDYDIFLSHDQLAEARHVFFVVVAVFAVGRVDGTTRARLFKALLA